MGNWLRACTVLLGVMALTMPVAGQRGRGRGIRQGATQAPVSAAQTMRTMVGGQVRTAMFYAGNSRNQRVPLVFVFHGHGQNGRIARKLFGIEEAWPQAFVIYPDGIGGIPDEMDLKGEEPGWQKDPGQLGDRDLKFFDEMLSLVTGSYMIDTSRIYSVGFSNGGRMTYLLWSQRLGKLAATAVFSSQVITNDLYRGLAPLPAMVSSGLRDTRVKYNEAAASFRRVVEQNSNLIDRNGRSGRDVGIFVYPFQAGGAETVQWTHAGGHEPPQNPGPEIVNFLTRHHR